MAVRKPLYFDTNGNPDELSATLDEFGIGRITLSGIGGQGINCQNSAYIQNVPTPMLAGDAVNKAYVDQAVVIPKTVELNLPAYGVSEWTQTFSDASVTGNSSILAQISGAAPTGKDADEIEMDDLLVKGRASAAGQVEIYIRGQEGNIAGNFRVVYQVGV